MLFASLEYQDVTPAYRQFKLEMTNDHGVKITVPAEVTTQGEIKCEGGVYPTIVDAVIALKHQDSSK